MKKIDTNNWYRKSVYDYFKTFSNPCYGFDVEMDVTDVYKISKENKQSFFINFLYVLTISLNDIEEMRTRIVKDEVIVYDTINPTYTIMTKTGCFENGKHLMTNDYREFYNRCHEEVERCKNEEKVSDGYNDSNYYDDYYMTCIPWLKYESMTHPLPDNDHSNSSVPRLCWSKYYEVNGRIKMKLNITVSHCLVDGYHLSNTFLHIQENLNKAKELLK